MDEKNFSTARARDFFVLGGAAIVTNFSFTHEGQDYDFYFRTVLQIDGCVVNIFPDPRRFADDSAWQARVTEMERKHQTKVRHFIAQNPLQKLSRALAIVLGSGITMVSWWTWVDNPLEAQNYSQMALQGGMMISAGAVGAGVMNFGVRPLVLWWIRSRIRALLANG